MHETIEALNAYVDDEVSAAERARIDAHLATCVDCASRKALLEQASASVGALPTPSLTAEESRRIREGVLGRTGGRSPLRGRLRPAWAGALALVVAGVVAGSGLLRNHTRPATTAAGAGSAASQANAPVFGNPGDVRAFVSTDTGVKRALETLKAQEALPAPAAGGGETAKANQQAPDALRYGANSAPAPPGAGSLGAGSPTMPKTMADANRTELPAGAPERSAPERSAMDCLAERRRDQADIRPVLSRPATYTGRAAWLLVYAAPAPSSGEPQKLAVYVVGRANCEVLTYQVVGAPQGP
ncbi:MAG TPA: zf-HC2 domain-containing protein [Actinomycetota bacterium]